MSRDFKKKLELAECAANQQATNDQQVIRYYIDGLISRDVSCYGLEPDPDLVSGKRRMITLSERGSIKWYSATKEDVRRWIKDGWAFDEETMDWINEEKRSRSI